MEACENCDRVRRGEVPLFQSAPAAIQVVAFWEDREGWTLLVQVRRSGGCWHQAHREQYAALTTDELFDVLMADLSLVLGTREAPTSPRA